MGDFTSASDVFNKLGFHNSDQWIFYDDRFERFFQLVDGNITSSNILNKHELFERADLVNCEEYLESPKLIEQFKALEIQQPGLLGYTEKELDSILLDFFLVEKNSAAYTKVVKDMCNTRNQQDFRYIRLDDVILTLANVENHLLAICQTLSEVLAELQRYNCKFCDDISNCFTRIQIPPLFVHQLPLDQYFMKCDSFIQYFNAYMKENFRVQDYIEFVNTDTEMLNISSKLTSLIKSIEKFTRNFIVEKCKANAIASLIDQLIVAPVHFKSLVGIEGETRELQLVNEHNLNITYEATIKNLCIYVRERTELEMELVLYENTKQKLRRALKRHGNENSLVQIICVALSNAELLWIIMQLDLDRRRSPFDITGRLQNAFQTSLGRMRCVFNVQQAFIGDILCAIYLKKYSYEVWRKSKKNFFIAAKPALSEHGKFSRHYVRSLRNMYEKESYTFVLEQLIDLNEPVMFLQILVYDGPVESPKFEHVYFLKLIFHAYSAQRPNDKVLHNCRKKFQEHFIGKITYDKFWRCCKMLWIWFLTEPKQVEQAINDTKNVAAKISSLNSVKYLMGIQRK